ncbi:MAG: hypothetical protein GEV07_28515, partial [Streptosporangiales bacterium]|nr:hypothetical protein [Streptosporangiales bacterium]
MTDQVGETVLRPTPGEGLLARVGDLVLLYEAEPEESAQQLLQILETTGQSGGDGRVLIRELAKLVHGMAQPPAFVAYGPTVGGRALLVHGAAVVSVTTGGAEANFDGAEAITWIDRILHDVTAVAAALGSALPSVVSTKVRLDNGVVPAGGFSAIHADAVPAAPGQDHGTVPMGDQLAPAAGGVAVIDEAISDAGAVDAPGTPAYESAVEEIYADSAPLAAVGQEPPAADYGAPFPDAGMPAAPAPFPDAGMPGAPAPFPDAGMPGAPAPFPDAGMPGAPAPFPDAGMP